MTLYQTLKENLEAQQLIAIASVLSGPHMGQKMLLWPSGKTQGDLGPPDLNAQVKARALTLMDSQRSEKAIFDTAEHSQEVFIDVQAPSPKLILVGAVHIAQPLVTFAKALGFWTIVLDARAAFATRERFPHADELIIRWPADALADMTLDEATYIVFLTHDDKLDNPALVEVLQYPVRYVGALGSKKTHAKRVVALQEMGVSQTQLARIYAPIGLKLGGRKPEEIAVSIIAEIVQVKAGG